MVRMKAGRIAGGEELTTNSTNCTNGSRGSGFVRFDGFVVEQHLFFSGEFVRPIWLRDQAHEFDGMIPVPFGSSRAVSALVRLASPGLGYGV
jgi:hypothetical protein